MPPPVAESVIGHSLQPGRNLTQMGIQQDRLVALGLLAVESPMPPLQHEATNATQLVAQLKRLRYSSDEVWVVPVKLSILCQL